MNKTLASLLICALTMGWGLNTGWGQPLPPAPPAPLPPAPAPVAPAPAPTPVPAPMPTLAPQLDKANPVPNINTPPPGQPASGISVSPGASVTPATSQRTGGGLFGLGIFGGGSCGPTCPIFGGLSCGSIGGGCFDPMPKGGNWSLGGGVYYMRPYFGANPGFFSTNFAGSTSTRETEIGTKAAVAPLAYLAYTWDNGWGIRGRWFSFDGNGRASATFTNPAIFVNDAGGVFPNLPVSAAGSTASANSSLSMGVYDLEATWTDTWGRWAIVTSAGLRYAHMSQSYSFTLVDPTGGVVAGSSASHNFNGFGPTISIEGHRQIGDSPFAIYGTARGSLLFGATSNTTSASSTLDVETPSANGSSSQTNIIPVGEMELGAEWARTFGRCRFTAQLGVIGQVWWGAGNSSSGINLNYVGNVAGQNNSGNGNLGFIGGVARFGISF